MRPTRPNIPREVDADVAMSVVTAHVDANTGGKARYAYEFNGVAERTALGDVLSVDIKGRQNDAATVRFALKRDSIYHILPEYLFHPLDRFLGAEGDVAEFEKRYKEQEEQKQNAKAYFRPFDEQFQKLRIAHQKWLNDNIFNGNSFLADFILSGYGHDRQNPFIRAVRPCVVWLRANRGNDDMVATALGYAFGGNAVVAKEQGEARMALSADVHSSLSGTLDGLFLGATAPTACTVWRVRWQTRIDTAQTLATLKRQAADFTAFFTDWFLAVDEALEVEFGDWMAEPVLPRDDEKEGIFLNYSTQLM